MGPELKRTGFLSRSSVSKFDFKGKGPFTRAFLLCVCSVRFVLASESKLTKVEPLKSKGSRIHSNSFSS